MKRIVSYLDRFFFEEVSATGFGLMRIAWASSVLIYLLGSASDTVRYYSDAGIMPQNLGYLVFRSEYRFSLLQYITEPHAVVALWCVFVLTLTCTIIGVWPRLMTVASVLLLFSFHERNLQPLGGGDTVLRLVGFLLMIAPEISACSLARLELQWENWHAHRSLGEGGRKTGAFLKPLRTQIWPYRLLLWQIMIIYLYSAFDKMQGTMWLDGTTVESVFHHSHFFRYGKEIADSLTWISPFACFYTLVAEFSWLLLLVPREVWQVLPPRWKRHSLKRWVIGFSLLFHWGIFAFMDVGSFPLAMSAAFIGLLLDEDFATFKSIWNRRMQGRIIVLYDGVCGLCRRSTFTLGMLDFLGRLTPVDFRDKAIRSKYAPEITEENLDRAMHIKLPDGRTFKGFDAFRVLCRHLPLTMPLTPLLYLPGVAPIGRVIYGKIAEGRKKCAGGACRHT